MRVIFKDRLLILAPQSGVERNELAAWRAANADAVLAPQAKPADGLALVVLGSRDDVCREPINISHRGRHPAGRWISNFADTPFVLDGREYRTVEGFWQGLRFDTEDQRRQVAALTGPQAKRISHTKPFGLTVDYEGETIVVGTWRHWQLMERANRAKFDQNPRAREALLSTGERPLEHRMRRDSRSIPGVIMADIWMRIRKDLCAA
jgi:predicted NAD-dependent protein-ADP-ribosyltransferase YbiA (DUF1768 family)